MVIGLSHKLTTFQLITTQKPTITLVYNETRRVRINFFVRKKR